MSLHDTHRQDKDETWLPVTAHIELLAKHLDTASPEYQTIFRKQTRPYKKLIEAKALSPKLDREIAIKVFVECCCKDWRTVERDKDNNIVGYRPEINTKGDEWLPFSPETAVVVMAQYPRLFRDATDLAADLENYQLEEGEAKNSKSA